MVCRVLARKHLGCCGQRGSMLGFMAKYLGSVQGSLFI